MAEKRVSVRLAAVGGKQVRAELEGVGDAGVRGFGRLSSEMERANARLAAFSSRVKIAAAVAIAAAAAAGIAMVRSGLEGAFAMADVEGTDMIDRADMALIARGLALRGDVVFYIGDGDLVAATDWDISTRYGEPRAYRLSLPDVGGGTTLAALAAEVLHFRIGVHSTAPWAGTSPLRRSNLTAGLLQTIETALAEVYDFAPIGSLVTAFPESPDTDMEALGRGFRGCRGRVMLRESVTVTAAGGPVPQSDWSPKDMTPDLSRAMVDQSLSAARNAICGVYGVLPALFNDQTQGPLAREAQRHLAGWTLQPIAELVAEECTVKLGTVVRIDTIRPLQAHDASDRARALQTIVQTLQIAKDAGIPSDQMAAAFKAVNFAGGDDLA